MILWRHVLSWRPLFPGDSTLCQVYQKKNPNLASEGIYRTARHFKFSKYVQDADFNFLSLEKTWKFIASYRKYIAGTIRFEECIWRWPHRKSARQRFLFRGLLSTVNSWLTFHFPQSRRKTNHLSLSTVPSQAPSHSPGLELNLRLCSEDYRTQNWCNKGRKGCLDRSCDQALSGPLWFWRIA